MSSSPTMRRWTGAAPRAPWIDGLPSCLQVRLCGWTRILGTAEFAGLSVHSAACRPGSFQKVCNLSSAPGPPITFALHITKSWSAGCRVLKEERNYILQMIKKIRASGANVLLIQKSILRDAVTDLSLHYLVRVYTCELLTSLRV